MAKSDEMNTILTRVGPGTPMGNLFRRFWLPALLGNEVVADGQPVRMRILGEDLVAFRDTSGKVGIVEAYCPHRGAPLYFGRNEQCGLRCVYHGWKYDVSGNCLDIPNIIPPDNFEAVKARLRIIGYPTWEAGGVVWVYMGPKEKKPEALPPMEWISLPEKQVHVSRWLQRSNWAQGFEGEIDSAHLTFIHGVTNYEGTVQEVFMHDGAPEIFVRETDGGFIYGARRKYRGEYYWRVTAWVLPMWSVTGAFHPDKSIHGRGWLPIDDEHTCTFAYKFLRDEAYTAEQIEKTNSGWSFPPRMTKGTCALTDGTVIDTFLPTATRENDYLIDRELQKTTKYSGIYGVNDEDRGIQEGMRRAPGREGTIDRRFENLVRSDVAILAARQKIVRLARNLENGIEPVDQGFGKGQPTSALGMVTPIADFEELLAVYPELIAHNNAAAVPN
jgi:phthalate 4,5-dioxygenase